MLGAHSSAAARIASEATYVHSSYCVLASRVLFLWDYLITMGDEVEYFWGRKLTAANALFLLNRYVNLVITIMQFFSTAFFQTAHGIPAFVMLRALKNCFLRVSCGPFVRVLQTLLVLSLVIAGGFAAIRVYAIWQRNWTLALPVFMLAMIPPALTIVLDVNTTPLRAPSPSSGCATGVSISPIQYIIYANTMRGCTIAYDAIVFALTVLRTRQLQRHSRAKTGLVELIIRDGCLYFMCLGLLNLIQMIVTSTSESLNYPSYFVSPLTSILISRFLLNLRKVAQASFDDIAIPSLYLSSGAPSVDSSSDLFLEMSGDLTEPSLLFSDTLRSHDAESKKDIESKS